MTTCFAGVDLNACPDEAVQLQGKATYTSSVQWTTSGTGEFENASDRNTTYMPSQEDISNGSVTLSLTANGTVGDVITDEMHLVFVPSIILVMDDHINVCQDSDLELHPVIENYESVIWSTSGDGIFVNENAIITTYTPGENDLMNGQIVLSLKVTSPAACEVITKEVLVQVQTTPEQIGTINGDDAIDLNSVQQSVFSVLDVEFAEVYNWGVYPEDAGVITAEGPELTINWNSEFTGEGATVSVNATNDCGTSDSREKMITISNTTGENENGLVQFGLYPNPANEKVRLILALEKQQNIKLSIVNNLGSLVYTEDLSNVEHLRHDIPVDRLAPGVYHVIVSGNNVNAVRKLIIE